MTSPILLTRGQSEVTFDNRQRLCLSRNQQFAHVLVVGGEGWRDDPASKHLAVAPSLGICR
jgi:hypothetical protein